jgi:hypothetical protein
MELMITVTVTLIPLKKTAHMKFGISRMSKTIKIDAYGWDGVYIIQV